MSGAWTLTDDGEFILDPAYEAKLNEIKQKLRDRWLETICDELSKETGYSKDVLLDDFCARVGRLKEISSTDVIDSFIIEALEGNIC